MSEKTRENRFTSSKNSDTERSKTPKQKQLYFGTSANIRESKSLVRPPMSTQPQAPSNKALPMHSIEENHGDGRLYYLGKGNNHEVIKRILSLRKGYVETSNPNEVVTFKWKQNSFGFKYHTIGKDCLCFNHFEFHRQITNKQRLVWNMITHCESNKLNAFAYLPVTYIIDLTTGEEDLALHSFLKFYNRNIPEGYQGSKVHSIVLPRSKYMPYLSPQQLHKKSQGNFYCKPLCPKTFFAETGAYLWILKPTFMNRGRGVSLFSDLQEFEKLIWKYYEGEGLEDYQDKVGLGDQFRLQETATVRIFTGPDQEDQEKQPTHIPDMHNSPPLAKVDSPQEKGKPPQVKIESKAQIKIESKAQRTVPSSGTIAPKSHSSLRVLSFVVQKYIQCPMLINERKFDIRVWVLLTHNYQVFFFKEGYLRFSSHRYSTGDHANPFIHLTNNSVQKHCNEYDESSGNQISLSDMRKYLPNQTYFIKIQTKIREIIWLSMCSVRRKINLNGRRECFELFGYDFMVDAAFKTWLIEVNTNPAIEECSNVLRQLVPRMIDDMFKLTLDRLFPVCFKEGRESFGVNGFTDEENMWQLLGDYREGVNEKVMGKRWTARR